MTLQQSRFLSLVSNVEEYKNALSIAQNAEGAGELQTLKTLESLESRLERLKVTVQEFYTSSGLESLYKTIVDVITNIVSAMNDLPKTFGNLPTAALTVGLGIVGNVKTILTTIIGSVKEYLDKIEKEYREHSMRMVNLAAEKGKKMEEAVESGYNPTRNERKEIDKLNKQFDKERRKRAAAQALSVAGAAVSAGFSLAALNQYGQSTTEDQDKSAAGKMLTATAGELVGTIGSVWGQVLSGNIIGAVTSGFTGLIKVVEMGKSVSSMYNVTLERQVELEEKRLQQLHNEAVLVKGNVNDLQQSITKLKQLEKQQYASDEAMKEYIDYRSQVAEQFPQLISGYDNEGNAVIDLADDYLVLNDAILKALKSEAAEYKQKIKTLNAKKESLEQAFTPTDVMGITGNIYRESKEGVLSDYGLKYTSTNMYNNSNASVLMSLVNNALDASMGSFQLDFSDSEALNKFFQGLSNDISREEILNEFYNEQYFKDFIFSLFPFLNSKDLPDDIKGKVKEIKEANNIQDFIDLLLDSFDMLKQAQSDYYNAQIDSANLVTERLNAQVELQERMNQSYPEKAQLLYTDKTLSGLIKDTINTAITQDDTGKIYYGGLENINDFYEKLNTSTDELLQSYASLSDRQQKAISEVISNRKNYTTQDEYIQALQQVGITNGFFLQYLGESWTNLSNEIQNNLDGAKKQFKTRLDNIKRATQLSDKLNNLTTIQDFPLVLQSTLINSIDYIITQYENGLFDYGDKLTIAFENLYSSMREDPEFMTKYATTLASLDFFDAYAVEDFIKTLEEDSVDKIIIEYFKNYASALNKGILTIIERAQVKTKDTQEKVDKMAKAITTGLDSYDDLNEWIQGLQKIRDEMEKVGKVWTLGNISLTNTDLFIQQDGKFYATATAYRLRYQSTLEDLQKEQQLYTEMLDVATRTSRYVNSLNINATESSFKTLITSLEGYNTDAPVQYANNIWNLWQEVIAETEGLTSFTDETGNIIDKDTYISQEFQKRYQALISSMQGVILQDQLELLTKDEILKTIHWEDLLGDRNNNRLKDSIKNALSAIGFTSEQITEFMTNLLIGGEVGVKALEDIFKDSGIIITSEQRQKAYRAQIESLIKVWNESFSVGQYVSDDIAKVLNVSGFARTADLLRARQALSQLS